MKVMLSLKIFRLKVAYYFFGSALFFAQLEHYMAKICKYMEFASVPANASSLAHRMLPPFLENFCTFLAR